ADGKRLLTASYPKGPPPPSGRDEARLRVWDAATSEPLSPELSPGQFLAAVMSRDGTRVVTVSIARGGAPGAPGAPPPPPVRRRAARGPARLSGTPIGLPTDIGSEDPAAGRPQVPPAPSSLQIVSWDLRSGEGSPVGPPVIVEGSPVGPPVI